MSPAPAAHLFLGLIGILSLILACGYAGVALAAVLVWKSGRTPAPGRAPEPVTVLKPLCGAEPGLYENLCSFCRQQYPLFQIIFGVSDRSDPALQVAQTVATQFPHLQIDVVVDPRQHGTNRKVSGLINMLEHARHDVIVMADSDARVAADYLASVTAPLLDPRVGLVTCLYHAEPTVTAWSRLGAMYINEWYMPCVLLAWLFGHRNYVSGQTLCVRRRTLQAIGGLAAISDQLADDYRLGELVRGLKLRIVLSSYHLEAQYHEPSYGSLLRHELRWMRTIAVLRPHSFRFIFLTFTLPLALAGLLLAAGAPLLPGVAWPLFWGCLAARLALHFVHRLPGRRMVIADLWLLPLRDLLLPWIWSRSFFTARFTWRNNSFSVGTDGIMRKIP